jgi:L-lactate dehydrogenase (cytochrome)
MVAAAVVDYRELARRRLPRVLFDYIDGGSYAEATVRSNIEDFGRVLLRQRVLRDVATVVPETQLFGEQLAMPVLCAPVGMAGLYARRGEVRAARAARAAGVPFCLSTVSVCSIEEVTAGAGSAPWFQLYAMKDRGFMAELLARARAAGSPVLILTVDLPRPGARYRDMRTGMSGNAKLAVRARTVIDGLMHPRWLADVHFGGRPHLFGNLASVMPQAKAISDFWPWVAANFDPSLTWADLDWVRSRWPGPIVIKGILDVDDAREAVLRGADGIAVSNHGGRQLDSVSSAIAALPRIADEVGDELAVLMDGGVRSGLDVVKALANGARACLIGRPWAWALGAAGERGVAHVLAIIRAEMVMAMTLCGVTRVADIDRGVLVK